MRLTRRTTLGLLATSPAFASSAFAQGPVWPNRRLRLVVPSAAGGYEVYARILAPRLAELLGQPVVVDNKPGANGIIGMQDVQRSPADGYTFMFAHVGAISIGISIDPNMPLDPVDDLSSISVAVTSPLVWAINPSLPFKTMPEFIAKVQADPGNWRYALPASGSIPHLVVEDTKNPCDSRLVTNRTLASSRASLPFPPRGKSRRAPFSIDPICPDHEQPPPTQRVPARPGSRTTFRSPGSSGNRVGDFGGS